MLNTESKALPDTQLRAEADAELAGVYGGEGVENFRFHAKWYCAGVWPFRRISFECPGCRRWLSVSSGHSARVGYCPSCDLTVRAPDLGSLSAPVLISSAKEVPALLARRLPEREVLAATGGTTHPVRRLKSGHAPGLKRYVATSEEAEWGMADDHSFVPMPVVTRLQSVAPWFGIAALLGLAWLTCCGFMAMHDEPLAVEIPPVDAAAAPTQVPLGSELWVVLDALSTARTPEEVLSLVRDPDELRPKLLAYYAEHDVALPHRFERASPGVKVYEFGGSEFARFEGRCDGRPVKFSFEKTGYGWRLDWESLVGYCATDWSGYLAERPAGEQQFRLLGSVSGDELIEYNRDRYLCLQLSDHLETATGFALVDRYGQTALRLEKFLELSRQTRDSIPRTWMTLILRPLEGSDDLLEAVELRSGSWLIP